MLEPKNFRGHFQELYTCGQSPKIEVSENWQSAFLAILRILASVTAIPLIEGMLFSGQKKVSQLPFECSNVPFRI